MFTLISVFLSAKIGWAFSFLFQIIFISSKSIKNKYMISKSSEMYFFGTIKISFQRFRVVL